MIKKATIHTCSKQHEVDFQFYITSMACQHACLNFWWAYYYFHQHVFGWSGGEWNGWTTLRSISGAWFRVCHFWLGFNPSFLNLSLGTSLWNTYSEDQRLANQVPCSCPRLHALITSKVIVYSNFLVDHIIDESDTHINYGFFTGKVHFS